MIRIAVLIKQVSPIGDLKLNLDGTLNRNEAGREMNPHCSRALSKGLEIAEEYGGTTTVFTVGPPNAKEVLKQAIAAGASRAIHISDPILSGADTYLTARCLSSALRMEGPFDLILTGRNSVDSATGQIGPQIAEFLDLQFLRGALSLGIRGRTVETDLEESGPGKIVVRQMPLVVSCSERLYGTSAVEVTATKSDQIVPIVTYSAADLGLNGIELVRSRTVVTRVKQYESDRLQRRLIGSASEIANQLTEVLVARGALRSVNSAAPTAHSSFTTANRDSSESIGGPRVLGISVFDQRGSARPQTGSRFLVLIDPDRPNQGGDLVLSIAELTTSVGARVDAIVIGEPDDTTRAYLASRQIDGYAVARGRDPYLVARTIGGEIERHQPLAIFATSSALVTEALARIAARFGFGMVSDVIAVEVNHDRIVGLKPAFGGSTVTEIYCESHTSIFTLRLPTGVPRDAESKQPLTGDAGLAALQSADTVIGIGLGVRFEDYELLEPLRKVLRAEYAATRKVTDRGYFDSLRQVGITGTFLLSNLYFAIGISGKLNHVLGLSRVRTVVAINPDPSAQIFDNSDLSIVADYRVVLPAIVRSLERAISTQASIPDLKP